MINSTYTFYLQQYLPNLFAFPVHIWWQSLHNYPDTSTLSLPIHLQFKQCVFVLVKGEQNESGVKIIANFVYFNINNIAWNEKMVSSMIGITKYLKILVTQTYIFMTITANRIAEVTHTFAVFMIPFWLLLCKCPLQSKCADSYQNEACKGMRVLTMWHYHWRYELRFNQGRVPTLFVKYLLLQLQMTTSMKENCKL